MPMNADTERFTNDPKGFLQKRVAVADAALDDSIGLRGTSDPVWLNFGARSKIAIDAKARVPGTARTMVWLQESDADSGFLAYYLPWRRGHCVTQTLGDAADFFFTSQLTDCRFSIITGTPGTAGPVTVGHTAGVTAAEQASKWYDREAMDSVAGFVPKAGQQKLVFDKIQGMAVRNTITERNRPDQVTKPAGPQLHTYSAPTSAFIVGHRDRTTGAWSFFAQITDGTRTEHRGTAMSSAVKFISWKGEPRPFSDASDWLTVHGLPAPPSSLGSAPLPPSI